MISETIIRNEDDQEVARFDALLPAYVGMVITDSKLEQRYEVVSASLSFVRQTSTQENGTALASLAIGAKKL